MKNNQLDYAISYAGEDEKVAKEICNRLCELGFSVFFAGYQKHLLVSLDGESFFEKLFSEAKEVIVLISENYKNKDWPRFEWDIIRERDRSRRFIPIKLDKTKILGLPSNLFYISFTGNNFDEIIRTCVSRLLLFERESGYERPSEYELILDAITNESEGALARAYQLVVDNRKRKPLDDCKIPKSKFTHSYEIAREEWFDFSVVKRLSVKILVPLGMSLDELQFNLKHCAATQFNSYKPDAVSVFAYAKDPKGYDTDGIFTAGRIIFAPFGKWEKAEEGVAYNIPIEEFKFSIDYNNEYFNF